MPTGIPTYTTCAQPGDARSHRQLGGIAGFVINAWLNHPYWTVVGLLAVLTGLVLLGSVYTWAATGIAIIAGLTEAEDWYYNGRLLCITPRDCAIGTIISEPTAAFDGDRKLNLMLAPYSQTNCVETLLDHITDNEAMLIDNANFNDPPFHTTAPILPVAAQRENDLSKLRQYMVTLQGKDPDDDDDETSSNMYRQLLIGVMDRLLTDPIKNFYNRLYRKDSTDITPGTPLWDAIPPDFDVTVNWRAPNAQSAQTWDNPYEQKRLTLNTLFRFDNQYLVPYLHCEIEGYYVQLLLDNLIMAFTGWLVALLAFSWMGPLAPVVATVVAILLFILKWLYDKISGNDGDASPPDVDWDDPEVPGYEDTQRAGDVVLVYGNRIMDTEHNQYFEIHPVRAYYVIARNSLGSEPVLRNGNLEQDQFGDENYDPTQITKDIAQKSCGIVTKAEEGRREDEIEQTAAAALSYGLTTNYAGG